MWWLASCNERLKVPSHSISLLSQQKRKGRTRGCCLASVWMPGLGTWRPLDAWRERAGITATLCRSARRSKEKPILRYYYLVVYSILNPCPSHGPVLSTEDSLHSNESTLLSENKATTSTASMLGHYLPGLITTSFNRIQWPTCKFICLDVSCIL